MSYANDNEFDSLFEEIPPEPNLNAAQRREIEKIASETMIRGYQALQQGAAVVQQMTTEAVRKTEEAHPGFFSRYSDPSICRKFIEQRPAVARAILNAESGMGTDSLGELYEIFDETTRTYVRQPANSGTERPAESGAPASILSLQQINSLPVAERRGAIEALKEKVGNTSLDVADPENSRYKLERGEE